MPRAARNELPSIYAALAPPSLPPVDLQADIVSAPERKATHRLARTIEHGAAGGFLQDVLEQSRNLAVKQRQNEVAFRARSGRDSGEEDDDDEERELHAKGFVHKKRKRSASVASAASFEGDDERGSETETALSTSAKRKKTVLRIKRIRQEFVTPEVDLPEVSLPSNFPSHHLIDAIHSHATDILASKHHLVPALTPAAPILPAPAIAHFESLAELANEQELRVAREGTRKQWLAWKKTRIGRAGAGTRKAIWADAHRAFEGTALVALGMLSQLLVEDAAAAQSAQLPPLPPDLQR
ncbi:hypothetical protein Rhopal_000850-T1 [Rhodotorula paludigena]|uniref:Uncharacterized protein n=1 Tax=Rhodotorula paludigena TaxID=86838 RepID=A0AAV5GDT0_9BASI|nr:hypothetical protein Rhopal_000850-T1 [Rhodotorula paludigena]